MINNFPILILLISGVISLAQSADLLDYVDESSSPPSSIPVKPKRKLLTAAGQQSSSRSSFDVDLEGDTPTSTPDLLGGGDDDGGTTTDGYSMPEIVTLSPLPRQRVKNVAAMRFVDFIWNTGRAAGQSCLDWLERLIPIKELIEKCMDLLK